MKKDNLPVSLIVASQTHTVFPKNGKINPKVKKKRKRKEN